MENTEILLYKIYKDLYEFEIRRHDEQERKSWILLTMISFLILPLGYIFNHFFNNIWQYVLFLILDFILISIILFYAIKMMRHGYAPFINSKKIDDYCNELKNYCEENKTEKNYLEKNLMVSLKDNYLKCSHSIHELNNKIRHFFNRFIVFYLFFVLFIFLEIVLMWIKT